MIWEHKKTAVVWNVISSSVEEVYWCCRGTCCISYIPWWCRQEVALKWWTTHTTLYGITFWKTAIFIVAAKRTSNPTRECVENFGTNDLGITIYINKIWRSHANECNNDCLLGHDTMQFGNISEELAVSIFRTEESLSNRFLQNFAAHLPNYTVAHPTRPKSWQFFT
jgi:hypothetical protein